MSDSQPIYLLFETNRRLQTKSAIDATECWIAWSVVKARDVSSEVMLTKIFIAKLAVNWTEQKDTDTQYEIHGWISFHMIFHILKELQKIRG